MSAVLHSQWCTLVSTVLTHSQAVLNSYALCAVVYPASHGSKEAYKCIICSCGMAVTACRAPALACCPGTGGLGLRSNDPKLLEQSIPRCTHGSKHASEQLVCCMAA
jgi:hypothetical protein